MDWHDCLTLWCVAWGAVALAGYGRSLAGVTGAQRTVRLTGRIVRVREPRHGGSRKGGIAVVVSYRDPATGQEVTVTNDGDRGEPITVAWTGREIGVSHPRGRPHAYRFSRAPERPSRGLALPNFAVFLVCAGLVALTAIDRGWPWALIGSGGPPAVVTAAHLPGTLRAGRRRADRPAAMDAVRGRIVAVLKDVGTDADGYTSTTLTPVVSFTTREGTVVTAHCTSSFPDPEDAYGRDVTVHHMPADPADFTLDLAAEHRWGRLDVAIHVVVVLVLAGAAAVGAALLR
ncbi:DUF3592 domain-containing protein [Streptomyces sp. NPDC001744]|uniref:DUF3592 domain-containing protein n=1 Tax=Streptomyces sp. NPDC001744 TaxID=3364606 RepID=UPI00368CBAA6